MQIRQMFSASQLEIGFPMFGEESFELKNNKHDERRVHSKKA